MASVAIIALEGVLRSELGQPVNEGLLLYHALKGTHKLLLVIDELSQDQTEHWLRVEGLRDHAEVIYPEAGYDDIRQRQLQTLSARGMNVGLVVDCSPARVAGAVRAGYTGLVFASPKYLRPEFHPGGARGVRAWDAIAAELDTQAELKKNDPRTTADLAP